MIRVIGAALINASHTSLMLLQMSHSLCLNSQIDIYSLHLLSVHVYFIYTMYTIIHNGTNAD